MQFLSSLSSHIRTFYIDRTLAAPFYRGRDIVVDEKDIVDDEKRDVEQEVEPEDGIGVKPEQVIEQGEGHQRAIDDRHQRQRPHAGPFTLEDKKERARAVAQNDRSDEAIKHRRNRRWPERKEKMKFWQKEKSQPHNKVK